jgi:flagellar biosynthesis protein FlhF
MKIKRFIATDIRQAMRMVREEQGPDAVILSNNRVNGGVEIVAAIDFDAGLFPLQEQPAAARPDHAPATPETVIAPPPAGSTQADARSGNMWSKEPTLVEMRSELNALRRMLEGQLSSLAWGQFARGEPARVELIQRLMQFGMSAAQSRAIADMAWRQDADVEELWNSALAIVTRGIPVLAGDILRDGGIVALVGPTGVGKTTTVAKLAARYALQHGKRNVALVTTDNYRVGAYEQLKTYGRILDVPVRIAGSRDELRRALDDLSDRRLVLIDTMGMSQYDSGLAGQAGLLDKADHSKKVFLLLSATNRYSCLDDVVGSFAPFHPDACILTKLDESTCLGGALSIAVKHQLPVAHVSDGQRVPEDLHPARADLLVARAAEIMKRTGHLINEDLMTLTFGKEVANVRS